MSRARLDSGWGQVWHDSKLFVKAHGSAHSSAKMRTGRSSRGLPTDILVPCAG